DDAEDILLELRPPAGWAPHQRTEQALLLIARAAQDRAIDLREMPDVDDEFFGAVTRNFPFVVWPMRAGAFVSWCHGHLKDAERHDAVRLEHTLWSAADERSHTLRLAELGHVRRARSRYRAHAAADDWMIAADLEMLAGELKNASRGLELAARTAQE